MEATNAEDQDPPRENGALGEVRKTNELIAKPIVRGQFTFLGRKIYNCMILHAQRERVPGLNAPGPDDAYKSMFWSPLSQFARDAEYESHDTETLKSVARDLMEIQVESETMTEWSSDHILDRVVIVNTKGLKHKGGRLWVGFRFPPEVTHLVVNPARYTKLPLHYITQLTTSFEVALYEIAKASAWKTSGLTAKKAWQDWQTILLGRPRSKSSKNEGEYKQFKQRVLKRAMLQIGKVTDVDVELVEYKTGRRVTDIQFRARIKLPETPSADTSPPVDSTVTDAVVALGIPKREADDIAATHDHALVKATCAYVQSRMANKNLPELESAAAYFRTALRGRYVESIPTKPAAKPRPPAPPTTTEEPKQSQARDDVLARIDAMSESELAGFVEEWCLAIPPMRVIVKNKSGRAMRNMLATWMLANGR